MASLLHSDSRRLYSWWWSSHISPKNSKWLKENLTDMDAKVKAMIKLIEEDADSFARRAEMYYKRRPELIKLVEEFYRAYRSLAERYNNATSELRLAHRTMAEAFPDQVPESLADDSASSSSVGENDPHRSDVSHSSCDLYDHDASLTSSSTTINSSAHKKGPKLVQEMSEFEEVTSQNFVDTDEITSRSSTITEADRCGQSLQHGLLQLSNVTKDLKMQVISESERASKAEVEVQSLKDILVEVQAKKDSVLSKYQQNMEKVADLERALDHTREDARGLGEQAGKAEIEIKVLKKALVKLESERDACLAKYNLSLETISSLEIRLSIAQEKEKFESLTLRDELSRIEVEKEAGLLQYRQCLETIAALEKKISDLESEVRRLSKQTVRAESEMAQLQLAITKSNEEKEAVANLYKQGLESLARMEGELSCAQEDARRLNNAVAEGAEKLKSAEEQCVILEKSNQNLQCEAENLAHKILIKEQERSRKQEELESLHCLMRDEHVRFVDIEASLKTLEKLYQQSREELRTLTSEIRSGFQMLKDLETRKHVLEEEIRRIKEENERLSATNATFLFSENNLTAELSGLNEMKEKLEREFVVQAAQSTTLEQEIHQLREETKGLNWCYRDLLLQIESVGLDPKSVVTAVLDLRNEYSKLEEMNRRNRDEKEALSAKFENVNLISEKNAILETSLSQLNGVLEESRESVKILQESCRILQGEKSSIVAENAVLVSQLLTITENMENLLKKNSSLENSLSAARIEIDSLKDSSRRLEEFSDLLIKEKSHLVTERSFLALQLDKVEKRLESLEKRFTDLEEKCIRLEKEKETTLSQVEELKAFLGSEKQEHVTYVRSSEACVAGLENHVRFLQDEIKLRKREFEEEIEKAKRERHAEASKLSTKLISELESENLEQQIETEMLTDEVARLRTEIFQIFKALQVVSKSGLNEERSLQISSSHRDRVPVLHILKSIDHLKCSLTKNKDEDARLLIENSILFDILGEIRLRSADLALEKCCLEEELRIMAERCRKLEKDCEELVGTMEHFKAKLIKEGEQREGLRNELADANQELANGRQAYQLIQEKLTSTLIDKEDLSKKLAIAEIKLQSNEEENCGLIHEVSALGNLCLIYQMVGEEKIEQLKGLSEGLLCIQSANSDLKKNFNLLDEKLRSERAENLRLIDTIEALDNELGQVKHLNDQLNHQILVGNDFLREKAKELSEVDQKLELSRFSTLELCRTVQELKKEHEEFKMNEKNVEKRIMDLLDERVKYTDEIEVLHQVNKKLQLEAETLRMEVKEGRIREEILSLELQKRCGEFELCESEAASFYFDLQISAVREVLLESKVQELTEACVGLKDGSDMDSEEIDEMKKRVGLLESEIEGLKSKLSAYAPILHSLTDGMSSSKQTPNTKPKGTEPDYQFGESETEKVKRWERTMVPEIFHLQKMQDRIGAIEKSVMEETRKLKGHKYEDVPAAVSNAVKETEHSKFESASWDHYYSRKANKQSVHLRNPLLMKDILLDENSDSSPRGKGRRWNSKSDPNPDDVQEQKKPPPAAGDAISGRQLEDVWKRSQRSLDPSSKSQIEKELPVDNISSFREMDREMARRKILERLASDAWKLTSLRTSVDDLKRKGEMKKRSKKSQLVKYEMVKRQLQEVGDAVEHLLVINDHLVKNVDDAAADTNDLEDFKGQEVRERARKESEKIGRLQFQVQNINYALLKMKDQKKPKLKSKPSGSGSGVLLRDFIYHSGLRSSNRIKKKSCFCGCATPRTKVE